MYLVKTRDTGTDDDDIGIVGSGLRLGLAHDFTSWVALKTSHSSAGLRRVVHRTRDRLKGINPKQVFASLCRGRGLHFQHRRQIAIPDQVGSRRLFGFGFSRNVRFAV